MRLIRRSLAGLFIAALTVGLLAFAGQSIRTAMSEGNEGFGGREARERVLAAAVVPVEIGAATPILTAFGEVRARRTLEIRAPVGGRVAYLAPEVEEGGVVEAGQVLLRVDPADARAALERAEAGLRDAEAELADAERAVVLASEDLTAAESQEALRRAALTRQEDLAGRGVGTAAAVETAELALSAAEQAVLGRRQSVAAAEARVTAARSSLGRARIDLSEAERRLADTEITAAFSGVLSEVAVIEGGLVSTNERLAALIDPGALEVSFRIPSADYARLAAGRGGIEGLPAEASLDVAGIDLTAAGEITREAAAVGEGATGRLLFAALGDAPGFRPGDFVAVRVTEPELRGVATLPAGAVDAAGTVLVVGEEDRLEEAPVELLRRQGDAVIVRAAGLAGREVIAQRSPLLGAGIRVRPIRPEGMGVPDAPETIALDDERRARIRAFVEGNDRMPPEAKARVLAQLDEPEVPVRLVERIEGRMGG